MSVRIDRNTQGGLYTLDGDLKTPIVSMPGKAGGGLITLTDWTGTTVSFIVGASADNMKPFYDGAGALVTKLVAADQAIAIPEDVCKFAMIQILASGGTVAEGQAIGLVFKS